MFRSGSSHQNGSGDDEAISFVKAVKYNSLNPCLIRTVNVALLGFLLNFVCHTSMAREIISKNTKLSTAAVIKDTLAALPHCLRYQIRGACFWLSCHAGLCTTTATPQVDHYLPDAVVSVFHKQDTNPWNYANTVIDRVAYTIGNLAVKNILGFQLGHGHEVAGPDKNLNIPFKEADVIGNPALLALDRFKELLLSSSAKPFVPYYLSLADSYTWRSPLIEMALYPQRILPGRHRVGSAVNDWGNVFPRTGFILQPDDTKAAAVIAQRAVDIATHAKQLHVYQLLSNTCGTACQVFETEENSSHTQWQVIYPITETTCRVFGENDLVDKLKVAQHNDGNYTWILWRHYRGCVQGYGKYLGNVSWKG